MYLKVAFFQKVRCVFQFSKSLNKNNLYPYYRWLFFRKCDSFFKSPNLQKKIFQKTILNLKFKFPAKKHFTVIGGKFKFQAQDSFLEYFFFGDLEIWKTNHTFWKKATFKSPKLKQNSLITGTTLWLYFCKATYFEEFQNVGYN